MIEGLLRRIAESLDGTGISYMIIGGQAVLLYGSPRLTRDVDITLGADTDKLVEIEGICGKLDLRILPEDAEVFAERTNVLPAEDARSGMRVDFIFSHTDYEGQAMSRTKAVSMDGYPVQFASCEDVVIHKMIAGRAVDEEDVKNILIKNKDSMDLEYVRGWLGRFGELAECEGISERFENLYSQS